MVYKWKKTNENFVNFELSSKIPNNIANSVWLGIGFSKDNLMVKKLKKFVRKTLFLLFKRVMIL